MATLDLDGYRLDLQKARAGIWFDAQAWFERKRLQLAPEAGEQPAVRVRYWEAPEMAEAMAAAEQEHNPLGIEQEPSARQKKMASAVAHGLITGLRGIRVRGQDVPCEPGPLEELLGDPELPGFLGLCTAAGTAVEHYRRAVEDRHRGN